MFLRADTIKGQISPETIKTITFYNRDEDIFEFNRRFSLMAENQEQLDTLLEALSIDREILSAHKINYLTLLKDLILIGAVYFEIEVDENYHYLFIY